MIAVDLRVFQKIAGSESLAKSRLFAAQMMRELGEMTVKPRYLFRHIGAVGKEGNLLEHAFVLAGDRQPGFLDSLEERGAISFHRVRMKRANLFKFFPDRFQTTNQILGKMFAFPLSHFD